MSTTTRMPSLALVVGAMLLAQLFGAITFNSAAVYAPTVAKELGFPAQAVGIHFAIGSLSGVCAAFLLGGLITRWGPMRTIQIIVLVGASGLVIAASGTIPGLLAASSVLGLVGGVAVPASSLVLSRATPPERFGFVFSIKQAGAPIGIGLAGTLIPVMLLVMHWRVTLLVFAAFGVLVALAIQPLRGALDVDRKPDAPLRQQALLAPLSIIFASPALRGIALGGFLLCTVQMSMIGYLVSYLNLEVGYSLLAAGGALTFGQVASVFSRLAWGGLMDRVDSSLRVLALCALASAALGLVVGLIQPQWPYAATLAIVIVYAAAVAGWNGVYFAGIARLAPPGSMVAATAGAQFFLYTATVVGPLVFAGIVSVTGSYSTGFLFFSAVSLATGIRLLRDARRAVTAASAGASA